MAAKPKPDDKCKDQPADATPQIASLFRCPQCGGHRLEKS